MFAASFSISPGDLWSLMVYDALFAWLRFAAGEPRNWPAKAA